MLFIFVFLSLCTLQAQALDTIKNLNPSNQLEIKLSYLTYQYTKTRDRTLLYSFHGINYYPKIDGIMYDEGFDESISKKYLYSCPKAYDMAMKTIDIEYKARKLGKKYSYFAVGSMVTGFALGSYLIAKDNSLGGPVFGAGFALGITSFVIARIKKGKLLKEAPLVFSIIDEYNKSCYKQGIDTLNKMPIIDSLKIQPKSKEDALVPKVQDNVASPVVEYRESNTQISNPNSTKFYGIGITPLDMTIGDRIFAMSMTVEPFFTHKGYEVIASYSKRFGIEPLNSNRKASFHASIPIFDIGKKGTEVLQLGNFDGMNLQAKKELKMLKKISLNLGVDFMDQWVENGADDGNYSINTLNGMEVENPMLRMSSSTLRMGISKMNFNSYDLSPSFNKIKKRLHKTYVFKYYLDFLYNLNADYSYNGQNIAPIEFNVYGLVAGVKYYGIGRYFGYFFNLEGGRIPRPAMFDWEYYLLKLGITFGHASQQKKQ